jgi:hypothetical protein
LREIAARYLPPEKVPAYIEFANAELGEQVAIYLRPQRWLAADLGPGAVPPRVTCSPSHLGEAGLPDYTCQPGNGGSLAAKGGHPPLHRLVSPKVHGRVFNR